MGDKRKLSRQQQWRAEKIQQQKTERAAKKDRDLGRQLGAGEFSSEQRGLLICRYSKHFEVEALEGPDRGKIHQCVARTNIGSLVAGDEVIWRAGSERTGVIESCLDRRSMLERPDNYGRLKPVAANIDQMLIVIAVEPAPRQSLIDRYLVAAELMQVRAIIVLNKADLISDSNRSGINALLRVYQQLGYPTVKIVSSRHQSAQLGNLPKLIDDRTSIIVGQSGVGKSSLVNTLLPDAKIEVGALSEQTREGTHTTTKAKLFHLPGGGELIDSPGIRDFGLWHVDPTELQNGFIEIAERLAACQFRNCRHLNEPGCAIQAAVKAGEIDARRLHSFHKIRSAIVDQQTRRLPRSD